MVITLDTTRYPRAMNIVVPCAACAQFVRQTETACPFCGEAREPTHEAPPRTSLRSRLAVVAGAALLMGACGGGEATSSDDGAGGDVHVESGGGESGDSGDGEGDAEGGGGDEVADGEGGGEGEVLGGEEVSCAGRCGSHHSPPCMDDPDPCPAPPYGTPPAEDMLV